MHAIAFPVCVCLRRVACLNVYMCMRESAGVRVNTSLLFVWPLICMCIKLWDGTNGQKRVRDEHFISSSFIGDSYSCLQYIVYVAHSNGHNAYMSQVISCFVFHVLKA